METSQKQNSPAFIMRKRNILSLTLLSVLFLIDITGCSLFKNLISQTSSEAAKAKESCTRYNRSPLFCAKSAEVVHALIKEGADVNIEDNALGTPLYHFVEKGNLEVVKELLANGADVDRNAPIYFATEKGRTPIHLAPIHLAVKMGNLELVKALIDAGADVNAFWAGQTPLSIALDKGHAEVAKLLRPSFSDTDDATSIKNFYEQVDICTNGAVIQPPTREQVENQVLNEMLKEREGADRQSIIRTREYAYRVEKTISEAINRRTPKHSQKACVKSLIENYNDSQQLAIIYDYCVAGNENNHSRIFNYIDVKSNHPYIKVTKRGVRDGEGPIIVVLFERLNKMVEDGSLNTTQEVLNTMEFSIIPPKEILKNNRCIEKFRIYQDNYVDSKEYFLNRLPKDLEWALAQAEANKVKLINKINKKKKILSEKMAEEAAKEAEEAAKRAAENERMRQQAAAEKRKKYEEAKRHGHDLDCHITEWRLTDNGSIYIQNAAFNEFLALDPTMECYQFAHELREAQSSASFDGSIPSSMQRPLSEAFHKCWNSSTYAKMGQTVGASVAKKCKGKWY